MGRWAFEFGTLWGIEIGNGSPQPVQPHLPAEFGEVTRQHAGLVTAAMGMPDQGLVTHRFSRGRRCFAAWIRDRIAAYGWVSQEDECVGELERKIHLQAGEAYIWNCATLPSYRRLRLYSALLSYMLATLQQEGSRQVWIGTSLANRPSIRGFANAGFQPVLMILYTRLLNLRFSWMSGYPTASSRLIGAARQALMSDDERPWGILAVGFSRITRYPECVEGMD